MRIHKGSIKIRIIVTMVIFLAAVTIVMIGASYMFLSQHIRKNLIQTAELNLSLVAHHIVQDINSVDYMSRWSATNPLLTEWIEKLDKNSSYTVYARLQEEYTNTRTKHYISRIIVSSLDHERLLHYGTNITENRPVNQYSVTVVEPTDRTRTSAWSSMENDPFLPHIEYPVIPVFRPIMGRNSGGALIGWSWVGVSADIILDKLESYQLEKDNALYLTLAEDTWKISGTSLSRMEIASDSGIFTDDSPSSPNTSVRTFTDNDGQTKTVVSYQVGSFPIWVSQSLSNAQFVRQTEFYVSQLAFFILLIILLGIAVSFFFNRAVNKPISRLQKKLTDISNGDFSADPGIEWPNELGEIGRGINELALSVKDLLETTINAEKKKQELEYKLLQSQINPHFLYNTLNSIKWMATLQNAPGIAEMTTALSRLLKNIAKGTRAIISLKEEMDLLGDYFLIQRYRYGGALLLETHIPPELHDCPIPRFTLQPLVENAIFHGIEPKGGVGTITITAEPSPREENMVMITITDDGIGMSQEQIDAIMQGHGGNDGMFQGFGASNVNSRLRWCFGEKAGMSITSQQDAYTCVTIHIPRTQEEKSHA